ncbi:BrnA antitoxin family protein [Thiomicrospira microaerophila]|uniref:BrnA antitoxin family protein n=1 Tax=Thiomicrospira microaerophila TaxID=406020 RepID=UPI0005CAC7C8|nr:BrnA antitoxin family protein [Thiomicrospira microaerophila]
MRTIEQRAELDDFELASDYDFSKGVRGRFYQPKKIATTLRLDNDILLYFKKKSKEQHVGYQTLINSLLREMIQQDIKTQP